MSVAAILLDDIQIRSHLSAETTPLLNAIHIFSELLSTNEWLLAQNTCGAVCLAEHQTAGRGRRGRSWQSPPRQNIYLSLRWCYPEVPPHYGSLSLVVGLAVMRALVELGISGHGLKWPNDIYYENRKLGGILLQTANPLQQVVIGIGLNVNMSSDTADGIDQPWCSLRDVSGAAVERNRLVALILNQLVPALNDFPTLQRTEFMAEWQRWDILAEQPVTVHLVDKALPGIARSIDAEGSLLVELAGGELRAFSAADVSVRL